MKKKAHPKLWIYFVSIVFSIMFITAILMMFSAYILFRLGRLNHESGNLLAPVIIVLFISVMIGTVISLFVATKILEPVTKLSKAASEVAKGNFDVRLDENERVSEIRELTRNFNIMVQELSGIETLRNDFIVNVSHEFKTPIASIEGYAMLLQDKGLSETERDEYTQMIIDSSRQLSTLTGNILILSKLENQDVIPEKKPYRLDEQIRQAVLLLEPEWSMKELDLQIELFRITYNGNEKLLMQVWMNLIGNAIKFTQHGGKIDVRLFNKDSDIIVEVSDNGCGIDDSAKKYIFDKFYQSDTARQSDGNGLGLALVKRIVDLCGGNITAESQAGKGTVFKVFFPFVQTE